MQIDNICGLLIEVEFNPDNNPGDDKIIMTILLQIYKLIKQWKMTAVINGIYARFNLYFIVDLQKFKDWLHKPRVIKKKTKTTVECIFQGSNKTINLSII